MGTYAVQEDSGFEEVGPVGYKVRFQPGAPALHPYQLAEDWKATGHRDALWAFREPRPPRPPVRVLVATGLARALGAMVRSAWWVAVLAAQHVTYLADRRAARLGRPMRPLLVPDYRRRVRRRYAFLLYALAITGLIVWPQFLLAYHDIAAHVHMAARSLSGNKP